jgi:hypothetical protein
MNNFIGSQAGLIFYEGRAVSTLQPLLKCVAFTMYIAAPMGNGHMTTMLVARYDPLPVIKPPGQSKWTQSLNIYTIAQRNGWKNEE